MWAQWRYAAQGEPGFLAQLWWRDFVMKLKAEAEAKGQTTSEAALRWILAQEGVTSVLVGASSVAQPEANIKCAK